MTAPWMGHPKLVAWFDDIEDAVTTAFALTNEQRAMVKLLAAPRAQTWVMLARDGATRDALRNRLIEARRDVPVPLARDCTVLEPRERFVAEEDSFERENGFSSIEVDYVEEGSAEDVWRELVSDAEDYAASGETGWFYSILDGEYDPDVDDHC